MKFPLDDASSALDLMEGLLDIDGSVYVGSRTELDCVVDTENYAMRAAGLLLRHRVVRRQGTVGELITLKVARADATGGHPRFQDNEEIEYEADGSEKARRVSAFVGDELDRLAGVQIEAPPSTAVGTLSWLTALRAQLGPLRVRALIEKRRSVFRGDGWEVCLDRFPSPLGAFAEIETTDPAALVRIAELLHLETDQSESRTYGRILGDLNAHQPDPLSRVALFDDSRADLAGVLDFPARR